MGSIPKGFLKRIMVDEIWVAVRGESAEVTRKAVRPIYNKFSPRNFEGQR